MSDDTYKGLTAEQWRNAYFDLHKKYFELQCKIMNEVQPMGPQPIFDLSNIQAKGKPIKNDDV